MNAIRRLASRSMIQSKKGYKLGSVDINKVESISTSASLVLTAELSRWDDHIANKLKAADTTKWQPEVLQQLIDVGFFELFPGCKELTEISQFRGEPETKVVKYIKGRFGDFEKHRELKAKIMAIVHGREPPKWTFLATGVTEAIANVGHHAYPESATFNDEDKNWYMGGSFNKQTRELRVVFYDQGISIPKSLPASTAKEKALDTVRKITGFESLNGLHDELLLKAAVEIDRTSTGEDDRGKGLHDLLNFIEQSGNGYISILSRKALYKLTLSASNKRIKTERLSNPIEGTLIIWKVTLDDSYR